ncbi:hypothetical protein MHL31_02855 [Lutibacter sp. A80]|uniref:hypothetical protein n=1 Tax=Lutibacter sp. A80 TaxID=2918453 RepID=UPI001F0617A0|nr:hypothetical protein [Lutibacter sp. A80]UMB61152.1 hypothetical protein MHL31_02855 [Lutibacter sp. A80]
MKKNIILTKIHHSTYIDDMYEKEYLYFKPLKDFRSKKDDKTGRLDSKELNVSNIQIDNLTLSTENRKIEMHKMFKDFKGQFNKYLTNPKINCCSLLWIELEPEKLNDSFNEKLLEFGEKALLIFDCFKFIEILDNSLEKLNYKYSRKKVEYYSPKNFNGKLSLHHKDEKYEYQNEYRILISPTDDEPINIPLPGLKKISTTIDSKDLRKLIVK